MMIQFLNLIYLEHSLVYIINLINCINQQQIKKQIVGAIEINENKYPRNQNEF